ncbi:MAG: hypothetical protein WBX27_00925, partial [Specibacter sp.]
GGASVPENLASECGVHHRLKHFKDGKARDGSRKRPRDRQRREPAPELRSGSTILTGWTPLASGSAEERPAWLSPAGYLCPPAAKAHTPPIIPARVMIEAIEEMGDHPHPPTPPNH